MLTGEQKQLILATVPLLREKGLELTKHFYLRMFEYHPELKNVFNMGNQRAGKQQMALAMAVLGYAENISQPERLMPVVDLIGHKHASLSIQPEQYEIVGTHLLASIKEVLGEAATEDIVQAWAVAYQQLADIMIGHEHKIYQAKENEANNWTGWKAFTVKSKVVESGEITSFYLVPADGSAVVQHQPGQYISIKVFLERIGLEQIRQYSISCAPNNEYYRISIKRELGKEIDMNGMISNHLHDHINEGDTVEISSPSGNFVLKENQRDKVFISGGIGQTPLLSMLEALELSGVVNHNIVWIHGCRNQEVQAFRNKLSYITNNCSQVKPIFFYDSLDQVAEDIEAYQGIVDLSTIKGYEFTNEADYYLCGPHPFLEKQLRDLKALNISADQIFYEEFTPASV
ncbi:NO-inducible flavohemoprotein [Myroides profundi]|uniref:Flavohemoprotein n=1 Tax=Myroides profundi TaxID=480520 RepID=A0AAJ4W772_MYRPR|nr:NO-inducible flavohemoprotein [Myroides profundi]AJH14453.1 nitric oxide dioxygenase [Myroides profundi]SER67391.1 nitric oxide dioxygenase [Myroides profundi]